MSRMLALASYLLVEHTRERKEVMGIQRRDFLRSTAVAVAPAVGGVPTADLPAGITTENAASIRDFSGMCTFLGIERPASEPVPVLGRLRPPHGVSKKTRQFVR